MTTLVYKYLLSSYIIDACFESHGEGLTLELCEPIDAKLIIGESIHRVDKGICRIKSLQIGEIKPKLYTGTGVYELESFVYRNGVATPNRDHAQMIPELYRVLNSVCERLFAAEREIAELSERVSRRISILGYSDTEHINKKN